LSAIDTLASGPYFTACGLLLVTGAAKLRQPRATADTLRVAFAYNSTDRTPRAIGAGEFALGALALFAGGTVGLVVACTYVLLLATALAIRHRVPDAQCGCIGARSGRVGTAHLATSACAAIVAAVYAFGGGDGIVAVVRDQPVAGLPFVALVATATALVVLLMEAPTEERAWQH
jgi:methylamine utilization protein MauE